MKTLKTIRALLNENCVVQMQAVYDAFGAKILGVDLHAQELPDRAPRGLLSVLAARDDCRHELELWLIEQAVNTAIPRLSSDVRVNIKVSRFGMVRGGFLRSINELLSVDSPLRPRLTLELPETGLMEDEAPVLRQVGALRRANVAVALGELGRGTSGFRHLTRPVFNEIKLASTVTRALPSCIGDRGRTVRAWIDEARKRGAKVSATGVENEEELDAARWMGCALTQGPLFSAPPIRRGGAGLHGAWCDTEADELPTARGPRQYVSECALHAQQSRSALLW